MRFYEDCSDDTFEITQDWLVECILCGHHYQINRNTLKISIADQGNLFEHYFWTEFKCKECGEKLFVRTKVYENYNGEFVREDHECADVGFLRPPIFRVIKHPTHRVADRIKLESKNKTTSYYGGRKNG